ncbi:hypothetical protein BDZ94DRAFT_1323431 [Collybia nuda]|uniref:Inhibitor I9 domain-containing protein n=1 Tax=Collybia nuda TaxID=64659 RepID=A0A9P5Y0Z4_9AGAR|nr:hypothetical protein BDZ94DRAFT_1323431 [Collybia nuda]
MPNKYIVVFKDDVTQEQIDEYARNVDQNGGQVTNRYTDVLKGFAAQITDTQLQTFQSLQGEGIIDYVGVFWASAFGDLHR